MKNWLIKLYSELTNTFSLIKLDLDKKEISSNKSTSLSNPSNTTYPTTKAVDDAIKAIPEPDYPVTSVNSKNGDVVIGKEDVGLSNVDNTSDLDKPVSTATETLINQKVAKIPDWDNVKTYSTDEVVAVGDLNNKTIYRSLEDNNTTDPSVEPVWEYVADVSDVVEYDQNLEWVVGDLVKHSIEDLNVILKAINDNTGIEEPVEDSNWVIVSVMAIPEEWDINTAYDNYAGQLHTSVIHNDKYWRIFEESIGNEPTNKSWEIITGPQLISGDGVTIVDGKINLGGLIESEYVSINNLEIVDNSQVGSGITISKSSSDLGVPGVGMQAVNGGLTKSNSFFSTTDYLSLTSQNKNDIFTLTSTSVPYGGIGERTFQLRSTIGVNDSSDNNSDNNRGVFEILNGPDTTRMTISRGGSLGENIIISNLLGSDINSGIQLNSIRIGTKEEDRNSLLTRLPSTSSSISVTAPQGGNNIEIFKIHGDGRVSGSDAVNENEFTTLGQLNSKQDSLISGTNIKTINGESILGSGNIDAETPNLQEVLAKGNSANNFKITNLSDGTSPKDAVTKSQLDAVESPFNVIDVTQQFYTDKAINVKAFENTQAGMTYQEGAIDFGVSRDGIHQMGLYSFKAGLNNTALAPLSFVTGQNNTITGTGGVSFGFNNFISGAGGVSFGENNEVTGDYATSLGLGIISNNFASLVIGRYSTGGTSQTGWLSGSPIFKVGNGTSTTDRKNAYVLYNDGKSKQEGIAEYMSNLHSQYTDRTLVDKEYVDAQSVIEAVNNAGVNGYRLRGNVTSVGQNAFDFSLNTKEGNGATGNGAIIIGGTKGDGLSDIIASGNNSIIIGGNAAKGAKITAIGEGCINIGSRTVLNGASIVSGNGISIGVSTGNYTVTNAGAILIGLKQSGVSGTYNSDNGIFNSIFSNTNYNANLRKVTIIGSQFSRGTLNLGTGTNADNQANPSILGGYYNSSPAGRATNINVTGRGSVIIGGNEVASSENTTIDKTLYGHGSVLLGGTGLQSYGYGSVTMGVYNDPIPTTRRTSFNANDPIFIIGNGTSNTVRSNSYLIYGNGKSEQVGDVEVTEIGQGFVLKSPDGTRWRITVDNDGSLITTSL